VQRVLVYGVTGSGKSTAAPRIAAALGLPVTLVDDLTWQPGWVPVPPERQREVLGAVVAGDAWVLDGAYGAWLDLVLARVELVVCLDYPRWLSWQRLARRTVRKVRTQEPTCNGNTETWSQMLSRDSILLWHARSFARKRGRMRAWTAEQGDDGPRVLLFRRPRDLERWIATLEAAAQPGR
jgi:adenylate kinase family enzyme